MPSFLRPLLGRVIPALGMVLLAWIAWHKVDNWCNGACRDARAEAQQYGEQLKQARERSTALALLWAETLDKIDAAAKKAREERYETFANLEARSKSIRSSGSIRISADALGVWIDASRAANAQDPTVTGEREAIPDSIPGPADGIDTQESELRQKWIEAAAAYADARDLHLQCVRAYDALVNAAAQE